MKKENNIRIIATNSVIENRDVEGFDIILDYSGIKYFIKHNKHNGLLYNLLKDDGVRLNELRRMHPEREWRNTHKKTHSSKRIERALRLLLREIDNYLMTLDMRRGMITHESEMPEFEVA